MATTPLRTSVLGVLLGFLPVASGLGPAAAQTVCEERTGELAIQCIQARYSPDGTLGFGPARDVLYRDIEADAAGELEGVYSGYAITLTEGEDPSQDAFEKGINAEHVFPQSKGAGTEPRKSDMHNIYPAREEVNSARSNIPLGESPDDQTDAWYRKDQVQSSTPTSNIDSYSERLGSERWEPREAREGDVARAILYFFAVYRSAAAGSFFGGMQAQLLEWHKADPVTQAEEDRSAAIATEQGNENPFVLDETLAERTFGTTSGPKLVFDPVRPETGEEDGNATLTVRYDDPDGADVSADVVFKPAPSSASAADIGGYSSKEISFPASATSGATQAVAVPITDDREPEGEEEALFAIENVSTSGGAQAGTNSSAALTIKDSEQPLVVNEYLFDPATGPDGDANQDGTRDATDDEFIEIYNTSSSSAVDLSGYEIVDDGVGTRHVFPEGTTVDPETAITVFGGGAPDASIPGVVQTASGGTLGLNNSGDTFSLQDATGTEVLSVTYNGSISGESAARDPDFTGSFVPHSSAGGSGGDLFSPGRTLAGDPLPVELASFEATVTDEGARLTWQTASETGNAGFEVQRRANEGNGTWEKISFVNSKAGSGTTDEPLSYRFEDTDLPYAADTLEYRLRQVDLNNTEELTAPITVGRSASKLELKQTFPNPARRQATVQFAVPERQEVSLRLYDTLGRQVRTLAQEKVKGRQKMQVDLSGLSSGMYFLRLSMGGQAETQQVTVVR